MTGCRARLLGALLMTLGAAAAAASAPGQQDVAQPDVVGARDPAGITRYPRSWIVEYQREEQLAPRELIMSRVDRIRRDLQVDDSLRVDAALEAVTYQIPDGATVADVVDHFRGELGDGMLFECEGRGCGRSADWANQVFGVSILYGPDRNQRYLAFEQPDRLVALYVNERGNQRIYAHLRLLEPGADGGLAPNALLPRRLRERGWAIIEGVRPAPDGTLDESERQALTAVADQLNALGDELANQPVYLVCHLYGPDDAEALVAAAEGCAETGAELLSSTVGEAGRLTVQAFGAGPMSPRSAPPEPRLELVLPRSLSGSGR